MLRNSSRGSYRVALGVRTPKLGAGMRGAALIRRGH